MQFAHVVYCKDSLSGSRVNVATNYVAVHFEFAAHAIELHFIVQNANYWLHKLSNF